MDQEQISHYRVARMLARGGMGEVYEAVDLNLDRRVALKFIAPELTSRPNSLARFEQEARSAAALNHPHIAIVHAFDRTTERPFLVMELLTGETLRDRIERGPLEFADALTIARDAADALAHAHGRNVIHRDVKPENLMFDEHGRIKVADFGLARAAAGSGITMTGATVGTAGYMAPESVQQGAGTPADVFALGVVLHEMLTGSLPFAGDSPLAVLYHIANDEPRRIRDERPELPEQIETLVGRLLAKDPSARPSAEGLKQELTHLLGGAPPAPTPAPAVPNVIEPTPKAKRSRVSVAAAIVTLLVLALGAGIVTWARAQSQRRREEAVALNNRGVEALQRGDAASAQRYFLSALDKHGGYGEAMINLGIVFQSQGRGESAESLFTSVIRRFDDEPRVVAQARYNLGGIDLDAQAWESAATNLEQSFALDSSSARVYNNYGLALVRVGRAADGLAVLERGLARFPSVAPLYKNAGLAAIELGRREDAEGYLARAVELDSTNTEARTLLSDVRNRTR